METKRLIIDTILEGDKEDYFHNISHDRKVLETFICNYAENLDEFDFSKYLKNDKLFAVRLKETKRLIGIILYFDEKEDSCEIGYGIGSAFWNNGYASEAVKRFIEYCFDEKGFRTVYASFFTGNDASKRVMEKCGMVYSRTSEKELVYSGEARDLTYYEIRREPAVYLLNGPSSAGKSTIAAAIQKKTARDQIPAVIVSIDGHLKMSPDEPIWEDDVYAVMPDLCRDVVQALRQGKDVVIDHVITGKRIWDALNGAIAGYRRKTVRVQCSIELLRKRETERRNRCAGSAEASLRYLYPETGYDLCIDSGETDPDAAADMILFPRLQGSAKPGNACM